MKEYKLEFHADYINGFAETSDGGLGLSHGKFVGNGHVKVGNKGMILRGYRGSHHDSLLDYIPTVLGGLTGVVLAVTLGPVLGKTVDSLPLMLVLIGAVVIFMATLVFELTRYLVLSLLYKNSLVSVYWDNLTNYCYAYPQSKDLKVDTSRKVLAISHTSVGECSPLMMSGKAATDLLQQLRELVPAKEKVMMSSVSRYVKNRASVEKQHNFRRCPSCHVNLDIPSKPQKNSGRCGFCKNRFRIGRDADGNVFIEELPGSVYQSKKKAKLNDYYKEIGVEQRASPQEIRIAYRQRVREYHPDKVANLGVEIKEVAERKTRLINEAYSALKENGLAD